MATTVTGKLVRDVRLGADGRPSDAGRLYLRGETVTVYRDFEFLVAGRAVRREKRPARRDKQAIPPATTTE